MTVTVNEAAKDFRASLDLIVSFIQDLQSAAQEDSLLARCGLTTSSTSTSSGTSTSASTSISSPASSTSPANTSASTSARTSINSPTSSTSASTSASTSISSPSSTSTSTSISSANGSPRDSYIIIYKEVLHPIIKLLDSVHTTMQEVERVAASPQSQSQAPPPTAPKKGKKNQPTPPPNIMSITHLRSVYTAIEILWCWGVNSVLASASLVAPSAAAMFSPPAYPKSMMVAGPQMFDVLNAIRESLLPGASSIETHSLTVWNIVATIDHSVRHLSLRGMMLQRNLPRLVLAAIALKPHVPVPPTPSQLLQQNLVSPDDLMKIIREDEDMILYIQALQHASRVGRKSPQREAAHLLTGILLSKDLAIGDDVEPVDRLGLTVVLRMHLHEGVSKSSNPTDLLVRVAKLVTSVPAAPITQVPVAKNVILTPATITCIGQTSSSSSNVPAVPKAIMTHSLCYTNIGPSPTDVAGIEQKNRPSDEDKACFFDNISSQLFLLMTDTLQRSGSAELSEGSSCIMRVLALMTARIAHMAPDSAHTFIFEPLSELLKPLPNRSHVPGNSLSTGIRSLHWVITCYSLSSPILNALSRTDIIESLLSLQVHLISAKFVVASDLKSLVAEVCVKILRNIMDPPRIAYIFEDIMVNGLKFGYQREGEGNDITVVPKGSVDENSISGGSEEIDILASLLQEVNDSGDGLDISSGLMGLQSVGSNSVDMLSLAGQMHSLAQRSQVVCQILTSTLSTSPAMQNSNSTTNAVKSGQAVAGSSYRVNGKNKKSSLFVDRDDDELHQNKAASITSLLFLRTLAGYLTLSSGITDPTQAGLVPGPTLPPPHICGAILLVFKDNISLDLLLYNSSEIIKLLGLFLHNRTKEINRCGPQDRNSTSALPDDMINSRLRQLPEESGFVHDLLATSTVNNKTGIANGSSLIEEITDCDAVSRQEKVNGVNKKLNSREDENSFKSLNNIPLYGDEVDDGESDGEDDIITTVLALLVSMLEMGSYQRSAEEEALLRDALLPNLVIIAGQDRNVQVAQTASDLCLIIMTRNTKSGNDSDGNEKERPVRDPLAGDLTNFQMVCEEAKSEYIFDSSPAMRGLGVRNIIVALREPEEPLTVTDIEEAVILLLHLMQDSESFVYLNAVHAIGRLIDHHRSTLFKQFLLYYSDGIVHHSPLTKESKESRSKVGEYSLSLRHRAVLSEAIGCALRRADQMAHQYVPQIVATCLRICRRRTNLHTKLSTANTSEMNSDKLIDVDLTAMRVSVVQVDDENVDDENGANRGQSSDSYEATLNDVCLSADEVLFRQSAFSLLAEAIGLAGLTVKQHLLDVVDVAVGVLRHETATINNGYKNIKDVVPVRRSAIFLLRHIVAGIAKHFYTLSDVENHIKTVYRALKLAAKDKDDVVKFHAECGLSDFDSVMREQLTLTEAQLTGEDLPKIRVIH